VLHILLALAGEDRHGYAIKQEVEARTDGTIRLGPGTLYEVIQRWRRPGSSASAACAPQQSTDRKRNGGTSR